MIILYNNKKPFVEGVCLNELTETMETPFYVYSQKSITDAYNKIKKAINAEIFYAVKANSNQAIISIMKSLGAGADVVSIGELKRALKAGIDSNKIIFEGLGKSKDDIEFAIKNKIRQINVESLEEIELINNIGNSLGQKVNIGTRLNPDVDAQTHDKISTGRKTDKFGIAFNLLPELCLLIKKCEYINLKGISCHIGSQINNIKIFEEVFIKMKKGLDILKSNEISIDCLDLGGGFGVIYKNEKEIDLNEISNLISTIFNNENLNISVEPGRYLVANAGILITKILTTKNNGSVTYLITDAGMQTLIRPAMYNAYHNIVSLNQNIEKEIYTIAGPICESSDVLTQNIKLPKQQAGNFLAVCDTGAYGFVMASNYNTKNLPAEILIHRNKHVIIREKENILNYIDKDIVPEWL